MTDIIKTQRSFARKARYEPQHRFTHLYRIICREDWITAALRAVLSNQGARTAGIDGITRKMLESDSAQQKVVSELKDELYSQSFQPMPVKRVYIPKSKGKTRPLGIATIKDRAVQMLIKMVMEPIWEGEFLNCSNGFRPQRRAMDCIALLDSYINNRGKFFWVIEGDIRNAFGSIQHKILERLLNERIADPKLLKLINSLLKAGVLEGGLFQTTKVGVPQGAICAPLLSNIYLHQLDLYWWRTYGGLDRKAKERRRKAYKGNCSLIRYADDWLLLTNGSKAEAYRLREEFQVFLAEELQLELAVEKTRVTHVNEGFNFLGFYIRRYISRNDRPKMLVIPSQKSKDRLKTTIKDMTSRKSFRDAPLLKLSALNAVLRGWINYYCHCNAKETAKDLDYWVNQRFFIWLKNHHRLPARQIIAKYKQREHETRDNWGIRNGEKWLYLYKMSDLPITKYRSRKPENPYLTQQWLTSIEKPEVPIPENVWRGNAPNNERWREIKAEVITERGARCEQCGSTYNLELHHIKAKRYGGKDEKDNAQLLCKRCHVQTPSYGDRRRLQ